jgi:hypothetical protein
MPANGKRVRKPHPYLANKRADSQPGYEMDGGFSRACLLKMNARFVECVERIEASAFGP